MKRTLIIPASQESYYHPITIPADHLGFIPRSAQSERSNGKTWPSILLPVGDLLEAKVEGKKIALIPKRIVDRDLAEALEDVKRGRVMGPFKTAKAAIRALRRPA